MSLAPALPPGFAKWGWKAAIDICAKVGLPDLLDPPDLAALYATECGTGGAAGSAGATQAGAGGAGQAGGDHDAAPTRYVEAMYTVDERDEVVTLDDVPQCDVGAPCPIVLAEEGAVAVAYHLPNRPADWDGTTARVVGVDSAGEPAAVVRFERVLASMFGPPNDEAFDGHPLASRGLTPYGAFEVKASSWIRRLERMNAVHRQHRPEHYAAYRHFVLSFHDSTFECVARGYRVEQVEGPLTVAIAAEVTRARAW